MLVTETVYDDLVVGAGIIGLAYAYHLAKRGRKVLVCERNPKAIGASVRNFGMIWPIGQSIGPNRDLALRSRDIWLDVATTSGIWHERTGSLHLAYQSDELTVLEEFIGLSAGIPEAPVLLNPQEVAAKCSVVVQSGLLGAIWSASEVCVDPREAVRSLPAYLHESFGVEFSFGEQVLNFWEKIAVTSLGSRRANRIWVCTGDDFLTLFPEAFHAAGLYRTSLQMLRTSPLPDIHIGPLLAAGLTLRHYHSFESCRSLQPLRDRVSRDTPWFDKYGIHVMASQHGSGEITIGDSHDYDDFGPFSSEEIDQLILNYLTTFLELPPNSIASRWQGIYCKHPTDQYFVGRPAGNAVITTGLGGAGMTLSFGVAEQAITSVLGA